MMPNGAVEEYDDFWVNRFVLYAKTTDDLQLSHHFAAQKLLERKTG